MFVKELGLETTPVFDQYWKFACERQTIYFKRLRGILSSYGLTRDPILQSYRFTNAYRAADRVSQFLIKHVIHPYSYEDISREKQFEYVFYCTLLFKIFNKIETWRLVIQEPNQAWNRDNKIQWDAIKYNLDYVVDRGAKVYNGAYMMPDVHRFGREDKYANHIELLKWMQKNEYHKKAADCKSLEELYYLLLTVPSFGSFLAFQYAIDLNYSPYFNFDENSFVVAGPGALDGIAKCFVDAAKVPSTEIIKYMVDSQDKHFYRLDLLFAGLFGRKLHLIDCQNLFCEISKYSRISHPEIKGVSGRTSIKQKFRYNIFNLLEKPKFPFSWDINDRVEKSAYLMKVI